MKKILLITVCLIALPVFLIDAQDWAGLSRYAKENAVLPATPAKENRVIFMGNSITEGWIKKHPSFFEGKAYINRGISGQTSPQMLVRFRSDVINLHPKVVVILAGTNDIAGNTGSSTLEMIEDNLASMTEIAMANGIKVILCSVLPVYDYPWKKGLEPAQKIVTLNAWIKNYSTKKKIVFVDYFSAMVDERHGLKAELTYDGVHPNQTGYLVMEPLVEKAIRQALLK
ncbi:MAG: lipolytic protein family [Bacteroidetes bacterium]|nr:lipolytic protein family [Bacteroidota bacterium]